jgi:hypothetical protein
VVERKKDALVQEVKAHNASLEQEVKSLQQALEEKEELTLDLENQLQQSKEEHVSQQASAESTVDSLKK